MMDVRTLEGYQGKIAVAARGLNIVTEIEEAPMTPEVNTTDVKREESCGGNITVFCTTIDNKTHLITLPKTCTIRELKELLWSKIGQDINTFRLAYNGITLNDLDGKLSNWGIGHESKVYIFSRRVTSQGEQRQ